jgi:isoleucyl-tRNA synthetase
MFEKVQDASFINGEHEMLRYWDEQGVFQKLQEKNAGKPKWSFLDGPITANNPMGVHHAWGRTYKDTYQRYFAMTGHELRYQNGFDCQGLWVEVEVEKEMNLGTKNDVAEFGIDKFVNECKKRVLKFAARQTEQSQRLGYWMDWDTPDELRKLAQHVGTDNEVEYTPASGTPEQGKAHNLVEKLGNPEWGGSYFTFATENNETIWTFLKKCFDRKKIYRGHDVMPWSGRGGSAYSQMEVADGRKLTVHRSIFVRFPLIDRENEYLLIWTTTPWTLTSNVAAAVNPDLDYVKLKSNRDDAVYYFAKDNLDFQRLSREYKEGFGRPEWSWPDDVPKLKTLSQIFKEQGGYEELDTIKGAEMVGWKYQGPFDELPAQSTRPDESRIAEKPFNTSSIMAANPDLLFATDFDNSWRPLIEEAASESIESGLDELKAIVRGCFLYMHANTAEQWVTTEYENWNRRQRFDYELRCGGVVGLLEQLDDFTGALIDSLYHPVDVLGDTPLAPFPDETDVTDTSDLMRLSNKSFDHVKTLIDWFEDKITLTRSGSSSEVHRIINGGRDNKGKPNVVEGEGTGIVHIAPGCGDIDHNFGKERALPIIAPLGEDGRFVEGFGEFTGKEAIDPATADFVFEQLKEKHLLVNVEQYPHIYPHCWRTGDELVFRLVDEWFINMDWREEIKDVTREIDWLPKSVDGEERELEWLTNMRDWMISKKRFWGLALPIWINPEDPTDFEVMGSLTELKERAVEGWDEFEGHTPHRPWIDKVKIKSEQTGAILSRIEDVGNPWLDAGIVPFSTMMYNSNPEAWNEWYPADFVTECFPGQFRNWFYAMLSMSTMMRYDETDDAAEKKPFKTLLGHRLVMNEEGQPMHKSDGTAIWFEEAAEQLGVDTIRWMYLAQNPASDLRFGTRHHEEHVELQTPEGTISETKEGMATCKVTSGPADEIRRQILIPLWNSYAFFVNYARLDDFDPKTPQVPLEERGNGDPWILSNLQELIETAHREMQAFNVAGFCEATALFIDDLSNWYIRRNRRRFWRSKDASDTDKLAAYQTLYEVLTTLSKLLAPCIPFLSERIYQNLVRGVDDSAPESVHLCDYPEPDEAKINRDLGKAVAVGQRVVRLGHKLREEQNLRVRQPLAELQFTCGTPEEIEYVLQLQEAIADELNVKSIKAAEHLDDLVSYSYKPNLKTLGPEVRQVARRDSQRTPRNGCGYPRSAP